MANDEIIEQPDSKWGPEARELWLEVQKEWELSVDGLATLRAGCDSLNRYHQAANILSEEGLTIKTGDLVRKHPCTEIAKNSLAGFLACMRAMGFETDENKRGPGSPTRWELWQKRAKL
jgi:phage terminase small subunit